MDANSQQVLEEHVPSFVLSLFEDRLKESMYWAGVVRSCFVPSSFRIKAWAFTS